MEEHRDRPAHMMQAAARLERRLDPEALAAIAEGIAACTEPWELRTGQVPNDRCYERVLATESYEVWVICWPVGGALDLHDHGGSTGAFTVVTGELDEARVDDGVTSVRRLGPGDSAHIAPRLVHAVANRSAVVATSVHVYSPPLGPMGYYVRDAEGRLVAIA